jgi:hypothetical protein
MRHPEALLGRRMVRAMRQDELSSVALSRCSDNVQEVHEEADETGWNDGEVEARDERVA